MLPLRRKAHMPVRPALNATTPPPESVVFSPAWARQREQSLTGSGPTASRWASASEAASLPAPGCSSAGRSLGTLGVRPDSGNVDGAGGLRCLRDCGGGAAACSRMPQSPAPPCARIPIPSRRAPTKPRPRCRDSAAAQAPRTMHSAARRRRPRFCSCRRFC